MVTSLSLSVSALSWNLRNLFLILKGTCDSQCVADISHNQACALTYKVPEDTHLVAVLISFVLPARLLNKLNLLH